MDNKITVTDNGTKISVAIKGVQGTPGTGSTDPTKLPLAGGTMSGDIDMDGNNVLNDPAIDTNTAKLTANEANVVAALDGATLSAVPVAGADKVLIQDVSDSNKVKTVTAQSIADLASVGAGDMTKAVYDPTTVEGDAFDQDNMADGITNKNYTATEKNKLAGIEALAEVNAVDSVNTQTGAVVLDADDISDSVTTNKYTTAAEITKLSGIEALAEVNNISDTDATDLTDAGDSVLHFHSTDRARANHTGTQVASTISDFDTEVSNNSAVALNTAKVTNVTTDLSTSQTSTTVNVNSSDGTDATLPQAIAGGNAGVMSGADKTVVDATSGTNSGDQTSIVGITGTKAQFDTAVTDGNILYDGDSIPAADISGLDQNAITQEINAQTGTSYTLVDADHGKLVTLDNAAAIALSVNTGLRSDFACAFLQKGAGVVTVGGTATVNEFDSFTDTAGQWALASLSHLGSNVFLLQGRLA